MHFNHTTFGIMLPLNAVRELIRQDEPLQALELLMAAVTDNAVKNDLILLTSQLHTWNREFLRGFDPPPERRNKTIYALLCQLTELEIKEEGTSQRLKMRWEIEQEIYTVYEGLDHLNRPSNDTERVLLDLQRRHAIFYDSLVRLAQAEERIGRMQKSPLLDLELSALLRDKTVQVREKIQDALSTIQSLSFEKPGDSVLLSSLLQGNLRYILTLEKQSRHKAACSALLQQRVAELERRYEKIKTAGLIALSLYAISTFRNGEHSIFGPGFDNHGYDAKGCDHFGYNREGFDHSGFDHFGHNLHGLDIELAQHPDAVHWADHNLFDLDIDFSSDH